MTGEHPLGLDDAVDVVGGGLPAHQDDLLAAGTSHLGGIRIEDHLAHGGSGRSGEPSGDDVVAGIGIQAGMEQLVQLLRLNPSHRFLLADEPLGHHISGDLQGRRRGALSGPCLQHVELALLDGELDVLHVAVMLFKPVHYLGQLPVRVRHLFAQLLQALRSTDTGHHVLALRVHQVLPETARITVRGVACEADPGG